MYIGTWKPVFLFNHRFTRQDYQTSTVIVTGSSPSDPRVSCVKKEQQGTKSLIENKEGKRKPILG